MSDSRKQEIGSRLIKWFQNEARDLPWRMTDDPYKIWVSEIMLQQTRVGTVLDYYDSFLEQFPAVYELANADRDDVLKQWEGLGYYNRARWMHDAAQQIINEYDGEMPVDHEERLKLSGIGEYTSAAIGAFAFGQSKPVVDGNVKRVISRLFGIDNPVDRTDTERRIAHVLEEMLEGVDSPGTLSEAIMELGALVCKPGTPNCERCVVSDNCKAFKDNLQEMLPVTGDSVEKTHHEIAVGVLVKGEHVLIARRPEDRMLGGLWEFPGGKLEGDETEVEALQRELNQEFGIEAHVGPKLDTIEHTYSHMTINLHVYVCTHGGSELERKKDEPWEWAQPENLGEYAFPGSNQSIVSTIQENGVEELFQHAT
ncbi:MAG: A/G-specific adenine glycosylase [bacterium]